MMQRSFLTPTVIPPVLVTEKKIDSLHEKSIAITQDELGIAELLKSQLEEIGCKVQIVANLPEKCDIAIVLDALIKTDSVDAHLAINHKVFTQARIIAPTFSEHGGIFITVQNTGGQFALTSTNLANIYSSGLSGLVKTAAQEWPKAICKAIDLEMKDQTLDQLVKKIVYEILDCSAFQKDLTNLQNQTTNSVIHNSINVNTNWNETNKFFIECGLLSSGERITLKMVPYEIFPTKLTYNNESVFVVSGGARGVTASCIIQLAKQSKAKFAILGRTRLEEEADFSKNAYSETELKLCIYQHFVSQGKQLLPKEIQQYATKILANREAQQTIKTLQATGSEVIYFAIDVQDSKAVNTVLQKIRAKWQHITGIIHGAGILADKLIGQKTDEQYNQVFNTKVLGLKNLLDNAQKDPLNTIIVFSSVAARYGNTGQCDYAMANEVLNKLAQHEHRVRGDNCVVKAINWGPWESGMITPELKSFFAKRSISLLPIDQGTKFFIEELHSNHPATEVIIGATLQAKHEETTHLSQKKEKPIIAFSVSETSHPVLTSHRILGVPVLPACLALEWFAQAANVLTSNLTKYCFKDFRVLRGIPLKHFYEFPEEFNIYCESVESGYLLKLIRPNESIPNYSVHLLTNSHTFHHSPLNIITPEKSSSFWDIDDIYNDPNLKNNSERLFHGPDFQAIDSIEYITDEIGCGYIKGVLTKPWAGVWKIDALAADGVLQLYHLWAIRMINKQSLPLKFQEMIIYDNKPYEKKLKCYFEAKLFSTNAFRGNLDLLKEDGQPYLSIRNGECCAINTTR